MTKLPSRITVRINKTNIRRGRMGDANTCAMSKAVQRAIQAKRRKMSVAVAGGNDIEVTDVNGVTRYYEGRTELVRTRIDNFINKFDDAKSKVKPKVMHTQSAAEYWHRAGSLVHTDPLGTKDADIPDNVRIYSFGGTQHGPAAFPPLRSVRPSALRA